MYIFLMKYNACTFLMNGNWPFYVYCIMYRKAFQQLDEYIEKKRHYVRILLFYLSGNYDEGGEITCGCN